MWETYSIAEKCKTVHRYDSIIYTILSPCNRDEHRLMYESLYHITIPNIWCIGREKVLQSAQTDRGISSWKTNHLSKQFINTKKANYKASCCTTMGSDANDQRGDVEIKNGLIEGLKHITERLEWTISHLPSSIPMIFLDFNRYQIYAICRQVVFIYD